MLKVDCALYMWNRFKAQIILNRLSPTWMPTGTYGTVFQGEGVATSHYYEKLTFPHECPWDELPS